MKRCRIEHIIPFIVALTCLWLASSCANARVNMVRAYSGVETALAAVDDTERQLCWGTTNIKGFTRQQLDHCTQAPPALTDKVHQDIQRRLIDAFNAQTRLGPVIQAWTANTPPPDLTVALGDANAVVALIRAVTPQGKWLDQAVQWVKLLTDIVTQIQGGK